MITRLVANYGHIHSTLESLPLETGEKEVFRKWDLHNLLSSTQFKFQNKNVIFLKVLKPLKEYSKAKTTFQVFENLPPFIN